MLGCANFDDRPFAIHPSVLVRSMPCWVMLYCANCDYRPFAIHPSVLVRSVPCWVILCSAQPWRDLKWLTGLKASTNQLTNQLTMLCWLWLQTLCYTPFFFCSDLGHAELCYAVLIVITDPLLYTLLLLFRSRPCWVMLCCADYDYRPGSHANGWRFSVRGWTTVP